MIRLVDLLERFTAATGEEVAVVFEQPPSPPIASTLVEVAQKFLILKRQGPIRWAPGGGGKRRRMSTAIRDWMASKTSMLSLAIAVSFAVWGLASSPLSWATDKLAAPGAAKGQETTITVRPDGEAGEHRRQSLDILNNGTVTCGRLELKGAIFARVVGHITFTTVDFGSCVYLGNRARLNTSSCEVVITSGGLGKFMNHEGGGCDLRIEVPGCTVHLGKGTFLELGYHNVGSPAETTALTQPVGIGGTASGFACLAPGPSAIGQYKGYLRLAASRNGTKKPFTVIL